MKIANDFEEILQIFHRNKVEFMIAGGYAVIFHGYGRTTGDLDIWIKSTEENKKKIIASFQKMSYGKDSISLLSKIDFSKPFDFKVGKEPIIVDIFNTITGVAYADAEQKSIPYKISDRLEVRFIHLHDLILNKMLTGRLKDKADVDELQKINIHSKNKNTLSVLKKLFRRH